MEIISRSNVYSSNCS